MIIKQQYKACDSNILQSILLPQEIIDGIMLDNAVRCYGHTILNGLFGCLFKVVLLKKLLFFIIIDQKY